MPDVRCRCAGESLRPRRRRYYLDELIGASTPDSAGNGLNVERVGGPAAIPDGRFGGAFRFGGRTDGFAGDFALLRPSTVTVAVWVRAGGTPGPYQYVMSQGGTGCNYASYAFYTGQQDALGLRFYVWNGSAAKSSPPAPNAIWDGAWHLVTGTYDGVAVRLYVDAKEVGAGTAATGPIVYGLTDNRFTIGNYAQNVGTMPACPGSLSFMGDIDEVHVFDRALSAVEIASLTTHPSVANNEPAPPGPPQTVTPPGVLRAVAATVSWDHTLHRRKTRFTRLDVKGFPSGSTVHVTCAKGCSRRSYTKRNARGTVSILAFARKPLRAGTKIRVVVTREGMIGAVKTLTTRARRGPSVTTRCLPPGATRESAC